MAVQIAQPADDVSTAAAPTASAPGAYKDEQLLSPVSKLEAARKHASAEQQRRVEEAVSRMASAKAENAGKRKLLEEKLDAHAKVKVQRTAAKHSVIVASNTSTTTTTAASTTTASTTVAHAHEQAKANAFASVEESKPTVVAQQPRTATTTTTTVSASYDATHELLRATRSKLHELTNEDVEDALKTSEANATSEDTVAWKEPPSTHYHLKQLGLVKKKIDIYAPVEQQQQEIRRLRDRSQLSSHGCVALADAAAVESENDDDDDSDFTPGVETESDEDSDAESLPEVEAEEALELGKETAEHEKQLRQRQHQRAANVPLVVLLGCVLVVMVVAALELSQQQFQLCAPEAASAAEPSVCASFFEAREVVKRAGADVTASLLEAIAALRARFHSEL